MYYDPKQYSLFISHSWAYTDAYEKLTNLLRKARGFDFVDFSVPKDDPIHNVPNTDLLRQAIANKIYPCDVVIILAGVYATYSKWINEEIAISQRGFRFPKPILAIEPFASEKTSQVVKDNATLIVGWNTDSIISAIRQLAS